MRPFHPRGRESGQVAVEAALIMPLMVFMVLCIIQLGMLHHARLMTEYAAYRAVRAGIVNSGSCNIMQDSALISLLPTLGSVGPVPGRSDTLGRALVLHRTFKELNLNENKYLGSELPVIRLQVLNPKKSQIPTLFNTYGVYSSHNNQTHRAEIDFDDQRDARVIEANLLTVRITYFYEMRVPVVNKFMHAWYLGLEFIGDLRGPQFDNKEVLGMSETTYLRLRGAAKGGDYARMALLASRTPVPMFVVPMVATYSMRMQSNLMRNQVEGCAVDA